MYIINAPTDESHGKTLIKFLVQSNPFCAGEVAAYVPETAKNLVEKKIKIERDNTTIETNVAEYYEPTDKEKAVFGDRSDDFEIKELEIEEQHDNDVKAKMVRSKALKDKKSKK